MDMMEKKQNMQEVNDEQLETVAGGDIGRDDYYPFSGRVGKYQGNVGSFYYLMRDNNHREWYYGKLQRTWDETTDTGVTQRKHEFQVLEYCGEHEFFVATFSGDDYTMFRWMERRR